MKDPLAGPEAGKKGGAGEKEAKEVKSAENAE